MTPQDKFVSFRDTAEKLWDEANQREIAANWRSDELLERAQRDVDTDYKRGRLLVEKYREHYVEARHDLFRQTDREYNNHIGMNQFHHRKGAYAAMMALLYKENLDD